MLTKKIHCQPIASVSAPADQRPDRDSAADGGAPHGDRGAALGPWNSWAISASEVANMAAPPKP
jgi:hypothetical protein